MASILAGVDDAEQVALRIREHDVVLAGFQGPRMAGRAEADQPRDLTFLIARVEVEVQPVLAYTTPAFSTRFGGCFCRERLTLIPSGSQRITQSSVGGRLGT